MVEAEITAAFLTVQSTVPMRITLEELGNTQNTIAIIVDNYTCHGFANDMIKKTLQGNRYEALLATRQYEARGFLRAIESR